MRQRFIGAAIAAVLIAAAVWLWTSKQRPEPPRIDLAPPAATAAATPPPVFASEYYRDIKPILDRRCLVCHGCYDAPCQLKLDSPEGLQRGATQQKVYDSERLLPAPLTRLFVDAKNTAQWRDKDFYPVLNEGGQTPAANLDNSVLYRMLLLKQQHPQPDGALPADFDVSADRASVCPRIEQFADYASKRPLQGMPFGLPGLDKDEFETVKRWLETGATVAPLPPLPANLQKTVNDWERFFNHDDLKSQLMSRYLFEHLFIADLYFGDRETRQFFHLVRSRTPTGQPIDLIASRRPTDDPDVPRVFYRLQPVQASIVAKTHLPYLLDDKRMARWREWFLQADYSLDKLPSYAPEVAGNPFVAFAALPVQSRYRFLLDDAGFFIDGFVKGPVCRGQIALNVLQDQFWVAFANPDVPAMVDADFLAKESDDLRLPAEIGNQPLGIVHWQQYARQQSAYLDAKDRYLQQKFGAPRAVTFDLLWSGDGNRNAALTVFRHFDSASVVTGLVGDQPKTAWVIDYPMFERIHYLLVAGFDVYGDASHQLLTRLYMDFLRMEGEANFLAFLPKARREAERNTWYRGVGAKLRDSVYRRSVVYQNETGIDYRTKNPKREFFERWRDRLGPVAQPVHPLDGVDVDAPTLAALKKIDGVHGWPASYLPELVYVRLVIRGAPDQVFTLIHNSDHSNVAALLLERARRQPQFDTATLVPGIVGAYPNALWVVRDSDLPQLAQRLATLDGPVAYRRIVRDFGVARSDPKFWQHSDWLHNTYREIDPIGWGVLDFNRYDK